MQESSGKQNSHLDKVPNVSQAAFNSIEKRYGAVFATMLSNQNTPIGQPIHPRPKMLTKPGFSHALGCARAPRLHLITLQFCLQLMYPWHSFHCNNGHTNRPSALTVTTTRALTSRGPPLNAPAPRGYI
jgi:hypothetical protein